MLQKYIFFSKLNQLCVKIHSTTLNKIYIYSTKRTLRKMRTIIALLSSSETSKKEMVFNFLFLA